jgi:hypothetical protein
MQQLPSSPIVGPPTAMRQRPRYLSDGKVLWSRLPLVAVVVLAAAVIVGLAFQIT